MRGKDFYRILRKYPRTYRYLSEPALCIINEDIEKIMTEWELNLGEADAINQGKGVVEIFRDFRGFEGAIFLTNDREVEKLKGKFLGFKVSIWKNFEEKFKHLFIP